LRFEQHSLAGCEESDHSEQKKRCGERSCAGAAGTDQTVERRADP
jgi:hypothetical protein